MKGRILSIQNKLFPLFAFIVGYGNAIRQIEPIVDTGFTGQLTVSWQLFRELGLQITGVEPTRFANGDVQPVPTALVVAVFPDGNRKVIRAHILEGYPLTGMDMLRGYELKIDCKHLTVDINRVLF